MGYEYLNEIVLAWLQARGIEPHEVTQALYAKRRLPINVLTPEGLPTVLILGETFTGRRLAVLIRPGVRRTFDAYIINAREMNADESAEFDAHWEV